MMEPERPPYGAAAVVAGLVLVGYIATLAPTVTLWDSGEFITAAKVLGIPHPPGTPLFVLIAHVWADVVAVGAYAWRLNLMSACFSAAASGCFFLIIHRLLAGEAPRARFAGAATATLVSAFTFTVWQNSNETEVYAVATFGVAAICWLALRWRDARGTAEAPRLLLLIVYLAALAVGNHLLTLLVGPALAFFIFRTLRVSPAADPNVRRAEWAEWGAVTATWVVLVAIGLGSTPLFLAGGILYAAAFGYAVRVRSWAFPLAALALGAVGVSTYAFLLVRSGLQPILDEGDPETWSRLLAVIRREQYAPRRPFDQMFFLIGPDKPHRTARLFVDVLEPEQKGE